MHTDFGTVSHCFSLNKHKVGWPGKSQTSMGFSKFSYSLGQKIYLFIKLTYKLDFPKSILCIQNYSSCLMSLTMKYKTLNLQAGVQRLFGQNLLRLPRGLCDADGGHRYQNITYYTGTGLYFSFFEFTENLKNDTDCRGKNEMQSSLFHRGSLRLTYLSKLPMLKSGPWANCSDMNPAVMMEALI